MNFTLLKLLRVDSPLPLFLLKTSLSLSLSLCQSTCSCPIGVDSTQRMVAAALFRLKDDDLARSITRASQLIRMLTAGEAIQDIPSLDSPPHSSAIAQSSAVSEHSRKLTWSSSSPLTGFDLRLPGRDLREVTSFSSLVIKVSLGTSEEFQKVPWAEASIYLPSEEEDLKQVMGLSIIQNGLQPIYASWVDQEDYDMKTLFGSDGRLRLEEVTNLSRYPLPSFLLLSSLLSQILCSPSSL
jgi:hypothetical protein